MIIMGIFVTTNIRISKEKLKALKLKAVEENKSVAQLIREAIDKFLFPSKEKAPAEDIKKDPFFKIVGMFESGIRDASVNHDKYIYGVQKKKAKR